MPALVPHGTGTPAGDTAIEFVVDPAKFPRCVRGRPAGRDSCGHGSHPAARRRCRVLRSGDCACLEGSAVLGGHQRPAIGLQAADLTRSMAERAGATITEIGGSHVVMVSQPQAVTEVILEAIVATSAVPVG